MILELVTLAISVPAAPAIMVAVAGHHLPTWWLIVAGMGVGWASDAVGTLFGHCMGLYHSRRTTSLPPPDHHTPPGNELSARPDIDPHYGHPAPPNPGRPQ